MSHSERRFDPQKRLTLTEKKRKAKWQPRKLLQCLGIQPGQSVLDLGCGPGFCTLPLAEIVGSAGKVWALDVSPDMLRVLAESDPPAWVHLLHAELPQINLPDASVDWIWAAFVVHEVEPLDALVAEMRRVLHPGGRLAILDWRPDAAHDDGPPRHHRLALATIIEQLNAAGFECLPQSWQHEDAYLIEAHL